MSIREHKLLCAAAIAIAIELDLEIEEEEESAPPRKYRKC